MKCFRLTQWAMGEKGGQMSIRATKNPLAQKAGPDVIEYAHCDCSRYVHHMVEYRLHMNPHRKTSNPAVGCIESREIVLGTFGRCRIGSNSNSGFPKSRHESTM